MDALETFSGLPFRRYRSAQTKTYFLCVCFCYITLHVVELLVQYFFSNLSLSLTGPTNNILVPCSITTNDAPETFYNNRGGLGTLGFYAQSKNGKSVME